MDVRDFDAETDFGEPSCQFKLGGRTWTVRGAEDIPWALMQRSLSLKADGDMFIQVEPFFRDVLIPEQAEDFAVLLNQTGSVLTLKKMTDLITHIHGQILGADRPTKPARSSSRTRKSTGRKSAGGSSSPATGKKRSAA